jgi:hypothetical protein
MQVNYLPDSSSRASPNPFLSHPMAAGSPHTLHADHAQIRRFSAFPVPSPFSQLHAMASYKFLTFALLSILQ